MATRRLMLAFGLAAGLLSAAQANAGTGLPMTPSRTLSFETDEATWLSLDVSPDGRSIVFDMLGDLYLMPAGGGEARAISTGMAFDSQPTFSPDGAFLAFVSDRSGAENLWIAKADGSGARQVTDNVSAHEFVSPAWSADGAKLYASFSRADRNAVELWRYPAEGGKGEELTGHKHNALGARTSPDGKSLYYAARTGPAFEDDVVLPLWSIHRRDLVTGADETLIANQGGAMRPTPSPDGRWLAYVARNDGRSALRLRDLSTGEDRLLMAPVTRDAQEATASRDLAPGFAFTPDSTAVVIAIDGRIRRITVRGGSVTPVPFKAEVVLPLGPLLRQQLTEETGPVRARLIQAPVQSPDGRRLAFSALGRIYLMDLEAGARPHRLTSAGPPEFMPTWSQDGRNLAYVTWTAAGGGGVWRANTTGPARPRRVSQVRAFYTNPAFTPDGGGLVALRSSAYDRLHTAQEPLWTGRTFGPLRQAELVRIPARGGPDKVLASGRMSGDPHFADDPAFVHVNTDAGLERVAMDGSGRRLELKVEGPGYYFLEDPVAVDEIRLSPDGSMALIQHNQQLHLLKRPTGAPEKVVDLASPSVDHRRLTGVGADFFGWADGGRVVTWAVGSTFYRRPLSSITLEPAGVPATNGERPQVGQGGVEGFQAVVNAPRDAPIGSVVLRGATVVTMRGDEVLADADVVVAGDRIVSIGPRGQARIPAGAEIRDLRGRWIIPGLIDVHDHFGEIRRGVLEFDDWGLEATLAWGVTTALDPSTLSIDMLAYQDLIDSGEMLGPRLYSTATAIFSYNEIDSRDEARDLVSRYVDHYRTRNLKLYRTGNRAQRQLLMMAASDLGAMPVAEGALDAKLDLSQVIDGISGNEHSLAIAPLSRDVVELIARSGSSYDLTLQISHGGPPAGAAFIIRDRPHDDAKVTRFYPHFIRDKLFTRARWVADQEQFYPLAAAGAAAIQNAGGVVAVGSHGNYPGIGYHWELQAMAAGGMSPRQVLQAATMGSAQTIGRDGELGSLEPGKFADLLVLTRDPLADVANASAIDQVMKNGRLYDAATLEEVWPRRRPRGPRWWEAESAAAAAPPSASSAP